MPAFSGCVTVRGRGTASEIANCRIRVLTQDGAKNGLALSQKMDPFSKEMGTGRNGTRNLNHLKHFLRKLMERGKIDGFFFF